MYIIHIFSHYHIYTTHVSSRIYIFMCIDLYDYLIYISMELIMEYYYFGLLL